VSVDSFAELGLGEETVEALVSLGIEEPTSFQEQAIPVIRRGNNVIGAAGPGAGTLVAYGAALLDRLASGDAGEPGVRAIVVAPDGHAADRLARSLARLGVALELRVAALGASWVLPQQADLLFASASELLDAVQAGRAGPSTNRAAWKRATHTRRFTLPSSGSTIGPKRRPFRRR